MSDKTALDLYELLPALYRLRDAEQGYPLRALLGIITEQVDILKRNTDGLWDDLFIETCERWVIPYIGDLVGNNPLHDTDRDRTPDIAATLFPDLVGPDLRPGIAIRTRADVAKTIYYRRRKGTPRMLEELARDVTGWAAYVVEFFELLGWTQHLNHFRPFNLDCPDLRRVEPLGRLDGPFDSISHTVDVRPVRQTEGWHNIRNIGFFLWRLKSYALENVPARLAGEPWQFHFSPLGNPAPLFSRWRPKGNQAGRATELHVPGPIRPAFFHDDLERYRQRLPPRPDFTDLYGLFDRVEGQPLEPCPECSFFIFRNSAPVGPALDPDASPEDFQPQILCLRLDPWPAVQPTGRVIGVDVARGRIAVGDGWEDATERIDVSYHYGFSADLGGGPYDRRNWLVRHEPGTVRFRVKEDGIAPSGQDPVTHTSLVAALADWQAGPDQHTVIEILDSRTYALPATIQLSGEHGLVIEAANLKRPLLQTAESGLEVLALPPANPDDPQAVLTLSGVVVEGFIRVAGDLRRLRLLHSTLVPGRQLSPEDGGPQSPDPSLIVEGSAVGGEINARLQVEIAFSITGPIRLPEHAEDLRILDSIVDGIRLDGEQGTAIAAVGSTDRPGPPATLERVTLFGPSFFKRLPLASEVIFTDPVVTSQRQEGCVRFSFVPSGSETPRRYRCQPDLEVEKQIEQAEKKAPTNRAQVLTGLASKVLAPFPTLTNPIPELSFVLGHIGLHKVDVIVSLGGQPTDLEDAARRLQAGLNTANPALVFSQARVLVVDDRLLILPGVMGANVAFAQTPEDSTTITELGLVAPDTQVLTGLASRVLVPFLPLSNPASELSVTLGPTGPRTVSLGGQPADLRDAASRLQGVLNAADPAPIFAQAQVLVLDNRLLVLPGIAGARIAFAPTSADSTTVLELGLDPKHTALTQVQRDAIRSEIQGWLVPSFTATRYGLPGYAQLRLGCPIQIRTGAEDGSEMGAFSHLKQPQREANLRIRLEEYLPFGLDAGLIYIT